MIDQTEPSDTGAKKEWDIYLEECKRMGIIPFTKTGFSKGNVNNINESDEKNNNTSDEMNNDENVNNSEGVNENNLNNVQDAKDLGDNANDKDESLMDVKNEKLEHN